jgi:phenylalanyl-tRNA synthetase beta chain
MKVVLSWLREFCPTDLGADELAERLTAQGVKVESIGRPWERLTGVVVARVLDVRDHPNSDKLCLVRVSTGSAEHGVVVGVRNMLPGDLVPYAPPGATVPVLPDPLGVRQLRGERSEGMLCSPRELAISADHGGILVLPPDVPLGTDFARAFGLDDAVLDIEVKSNRPDLLSVVGVAREAAAATGVPFSPPDASVSEGEPKAADAATVEVLDLERCPRYLARVIRGTSIRPSPIRVQARLTATGMRPISTVVDATNYVMLEMGQPMHPFDLELLAGPGIVVRRAGDAEPLVTLDDVERTLCDEDLVIADLERVVGIAGVMGSAAAEVSPRTADVLLESAHFAPTGVLRTSRRLDLSTEASVRFGRGTDPEAVGAAAARAARLMIEWGGGTVLTGAVDVGSQPERRRVRFRPARAAAVLGYQVHPDEASDAFERLGIPVALVGEEIETIVPSHRWDLRIEEDLIEEVARIRGYDALPETLPPVRQAGGVPDTYAFRGRVRDALVRAGLREAISYSFASEQDLELLGDPPARAVRVSNPLSADQAFLRTSLVPGLIRAMRTNLSRYVRGAALFEVGRVFGLPDAGAEPVETERVGFVLGGEIVTVVPGERRIVDFFDAKGALEGLMAALSVRSWRLAEPAPPPWHPGRSAVIRVGDRFAGTIGEILPRVREELDLPAGTSVAELGTATLAEAAGLPFEYHDVPRFPPVRRDLAFVIPSDVPTGAIRDVIRTAGAPLVDAVVLFDVFTGGSIPEGKRSLAFSVDLRSPDRTLTDEEAASAVGAVVAALAERFGAELRAG